LPLRQRRINPYQLGHGGDYVNLLLHRRDLHARAYVGPEGQEEEPLVSLADSPVLLKAAVLVVVAAVVVGDDHSGLVGVDRVGLDFLPQFVDDLVSGTDGIGVGDPVTAVAGHIHLSQVEEDQPGVIDVHHPLHLGPVDLVVVLSREGEGGSIRSTEQGVQAVVGVVNVALPHHGPGLLLGQFRVSAAILLEEGGSTGPQVQLEPDVGHRLPGTVDQGVVGGGGVGLGAVVEVAVDGPLGTQVIP